MNKVLEKKEELLTRFDEKFAKEEVADSWDYSELHDFSSLGVYSRIKVFISDALDEMADTAREETEVKADVEIDRALEERDNAEEWADQLANTIAVRSGVDIGEHSNMNHPWANALEALDQLKAHTGQGEEKA